MLQKCSQQCEGSAQPRLGKLKFPQVASEPVSAQATTLGIVLSDSRPKGSSNPGKSELIGTGKTSLEEALRTWTKVKVMLPPPASGADASWAPDSEGVKSCCRVFTLF